MKEKIKKIFENGKGVFITLFILELAVTMFITPNKYDDKTFLESVTGTSIISYIGPRYFTWTSRFFIEYVLCLVLKISKYAWVLIEALMVTLVGYSISKIFIKEDKKQNEIMLLFMILIYPLNAMNSAGWAATTVNYMWPLATCLFALIPIRKIWDGDKIKFWEYPLYTISLIFAGNQEQTSSILCGTYILFTIFMIIKNKKIHPYMIIQSLFAISSIVFILTCPGNYIRNEQEIGEIFKDFEMLSFLDKFSLGLTSTMGFIIKKRNLVYTILSFLITIYVFSTYKEKVFRVVAIIPLLSVCLLGITPYITNTIFPYFGSFRELIIEEQVMLTSANSNNLLNIVPLVFAFTNFICLGLSIILIFKNLKNNIAILVFLVGLASKIIIGFSPTVFSSIERSMIFFEFSMIIVSLLIWQELVKKTDKNDKKIQKRTEVLIKTVGILQYINVFFCVLLTQK